MIKFKSLRSTTRDLKIIKSLHKFLKKIDSQKQLIRKKIRIIERRSREKEQNLDLYLIERNPYDGSIQSNYQRMLDGKKEGKYNRFFDTSDTDWGNV